MPSVDLVTLFLGLCTLGGLYMVSQSAKAKVTWETTVLRVSVLLLILGAILLFIPVASVGGILHLETKYLNGSFTHPGVLLVLIGAAGIYLSKPKRE